MVIGAGKSGKTSLVNALNDYHGRLRKTQDGGADPIPPRFD